MTIRSELQELGPDVVRRAMVAFEHRGDRPFGWERSPQCEVGWIGDCCFLRHAFPVQPQEQFNEYMEWRARGSHLEGAFEFGDREALRLECIAYLAEHGTTPEPAPRKSPRVFRVAALVCLLLLLVV